MFHCQSSAGGGSSLRVHAVRFGPGQELLGSLREFVEERRLQAPFIITCVGSVTKATLRLANATATDSNKVSFWFIPDSVLLLKIKKSCFTTETMNNKQNLQFHLEFLVCLV